MELKILFEEVLRRIPEFEVDEQSKLKWAPMKVQGIVEVANRFLSGSKSA